MKKWSMFRELLLESGWPPLRPWLLRQQQRQHRLLVKLSEKLLFLPLLSAVPGLQG